MANSMDSPRRIRMGVNSHVRFCERNASSPLFMGRRRTCDLHVRGRLVSRVHASVQGREDGFHLTDMSINGTFVLQEDGSSYSVPPGTEVRLEGAGLISLGEPVDPANRQLIRYRCKW